MPAKSRTNAQQHLVRSQLNFGLAYAREARAAYKSDRNTYRDLARDIAAKAYCAAVRFAAQLPTGMAPSVSDQLVELETELAGLGRPEEMPSNRVDAFAADRQRSPNLSGP